MLESLLCNSCGAPLEVPDTANFIKCNHCQTQLAIRRNEQATFTQAVEQLSKATESLNGQVAELNRKQSLADLERRWERDREKFYIESENGRRHLPTEGTAVLGGVVAALFGIFWTIMAFSMTRNSPFGGTGLFPLFGVLFIGFGIFSSIHAHQKAKDYKLARKKYDQQRAALLQAHSVSSDNDFHIETR